jgi:hypothetical protein
MADEFDDEEIDLDDEAEDGGDIALVDDDALVDVIATDDEETELDVADAAAVPVKDGVPGGTDEDSDDEDDENLDLEEELHPDDVEEPLDVLLKERTAAERMDEDEAELEDDDEPDGPADGGGKIVPRRDDEFLCRSCFLVKPLSQLAKGEKDLCRDCE